MKQAISLILFALLINASSSLYAQKLVACESYDSAGKASSVYSTWDIKPAGSYIYLHYSQPAALGSGAWTLLIERDSTSSGKFITHKKVTLQPRKGKNWIVNDAFFPGKGKYKCTIRWNGQIKATTILTVEVKNDMDDEDAEDTYYYEDSEMIFCKSVDKEGNTQGDATSFSLGTGSKATISIYIQNDGKPFKTKKVYATIYKGLNKVKEYDLDIESEWNFFSFKHTFTEAGEYTVEIYNGNDVFMNTANVTITR